MVNRKGFNRGGKGSNQYVTRPGDDSIEAQAETVNLMNQLKPLSVPKVGEANDTYDQNKELRSAIKAARDGDESAAAAIRNTVPNSVSDQVLSGSAGNDLLAGRQTSEEDIVSGTIKKRQAEEVDVTDAHKEQYEVSAAIYSQARSQETMTNGRAEGIVSKINNLIDRRVASLGI